VSEPVKRRPKQSTLSARQLDTFLAAIAAGSSVLEAAKATGRAYQRFYDRRKVDEDFDRRWAEAYDQSTLVIEAEAERRAIDGYDEVTYGADGRVLRRVHRYDGPLLQLLLKARRPDVYREAQTVVNTQPTTIVMQSAFPGIGEHIDGQLIEEGDVLELEAADGIGDAGRGAEGV
jgi:hypothetical protein